MNSSSRFTLKLLLLIATIFLTNIARVKTYGQSEPVVAKVNGKGITQNTVDETAASQIFTLQQQIFALRKASLENLITRRVLEFEAQKQNVSVDQLREQLTRGEIAVTTDQVEQAYAENASFFGSMSPDEARERLRLDLETQARMRLFRAAVARLKESQHIEILLEEPRLAISNYFPKAPVRGPKDASVTVVEFSDFQCPFCRNSQGQIKQLLSTFGSDLKIVFKHLPLDSHAKSFEAARAAYCAGEQNVFWEFHDALFAAPELSADQLQNAANELGLSIDKFNSCLSSEVSRGAVLKDLAEAKRLGINSTPSFVINGKLVRGLISFEEFKGIIDRELRALRQPTRSVSQSGSSLVKEKE